MDVAKILRNQDESSIEMVPAKDGRKIKRRKRSESTADKFKKVGASVFDQLKKNVEASIKQK